MLELEIDAHGVVVFDSHIFGSQLFPAVLHSNPTKNANKTIPNPPQITQNPLILPKLLLLLPFFLNVEIIQILDITLIKKMLKLPLINPITLP